MRAMHSYDATSYSWAPTATQARSEPDTDSRLNFFAAAAMRVSACATGMTALVSPFFVL